jgi:hypothetical protein
MPEKMAGSTVPPRPFSLSATVVGRNFLWSPFEERVHLSANGRPEV